jgi:hypothetical protein
MKLNKISFILLCAVAIVTSPSVALAQRDNTDAGFSGKVTAVDAKAKTITITPSARSGGEAKTFTVTDTTKIEVEGKAGTLADVKMDMMAKVIPGADPNSAAAITAKTGKRGDGGGAGGRGNAGTPGGGR